MAKTFIPHREERLPLGDASSGPRSARNIHGPLYGPAKPARTRNARPARAKAKPVAAPLVQGNPTTAI